MYRPSGCSAARLCALIAFLWLTVSVHAADLNDPEIQARLARGEIITELHKEPGTHILVGTATGVINATREQVWSVIGDFNHFTEFMPSFKESFVLRPDVLSKLGDSPRLKNVEPLLRENKLDSALTDTLLLYHCFNFPFPLGNRRCIIRLVRDPATFRSHYDLVTGDFKVNEGWWELEPYGEKTLAIYRTRTDPGLPVPGFLVSIGMKTTLPDVIVGVRRRARELFLPKGEAHGDKG